jgi:glycosyltransferase involved in cell wall biosynthesis
MRFLTVYDLAYLRFPRIYGAAYRRSSMAALRSLGPGDRLITTSRFVRDELCENGVAPAARIHVVPLAAHPSLFYQCPDADAIAAVRVRYGIPEGPYVLSVNSPDPRKNVPHAIHAFARAAHEGRDALTSLVLTGNAGPGSDRIHQTIAGYPALRGRVILTGHVPDEDLAPLYTGARVFVYPSIYEGFGLPPLEAMQCGTPTITSNTSSLPEVVGDGGVMVAPDDVDGLAGQMLDLARDSDRRRCLQQRALAQARRFSWELSTAATLGAYRAALQG